MGVASVADARQCLSFQLGEEAFAIDVSNVREMRVFILEP